ncbi:MAG: amidohydrolase family protein [Bacteroidales bacterium]|nr:amidohydrolase family protein [Bacteroidales bacterium]
MRRISATYIYTGKNILKNGIVEIDDDGKIINVIDAKGKLKEEQSLEYYSGVIVPGFINAHCHLELSHMKGMIDNKTVKGLPGFIDEIISKRNFPDDLQEKIKQADRETEINGIVAVGDISNTDDSFSVKKKSKIFYHTFIETFTINNKEANEAFNTAKENKQKLNTLNLKGTIVPHASYSVPDALYEKIVDFEPDTKKVISIHNQETPGEDEFIQTQSGALADVMKNKGFDFSDFSFPGNTSLESNLIRQKKRDNILLIHNTFSKEADVEYAENFSKNIYWVFCPLSNLYIEKKLPDLPLFFDKRLKTCIGTDSYASNTELSILSELKVITKNFPDISFENLIESACLNGAKALQIENEFGSIEIGKTPGINLITDFDFEKMNLKESSKLKVLV